MKEKAKILDKEALNRVLMRIAHEILEKNKGTQDLCLVGIQKPRGISGQAPGECIEKIEDQERTGGNFGYYFIPR